MRITRRAATIVILTLLLLGAAGWWFVRIPEPAFNGVPLGIYLDTFRSEPQKAYAAVRALGPSAVPYLVEEMKPDPIFENLNRASPRLPASLQSLLPDHISYLNRRMHASALLGSLGTNAISAVPVLLTINLTNDLLFLSQTVDLIGRLAPGTKYERKAVNALLEAITNGSAHYNGKALKKAAYQHLGAFTYSQEQIIPILVSGLHEPGMSGACIAGLVKFGTNAIPALRNASLSETNHVRPATVALEKIEKNIRLSDTNK